MRKIAEPSLVEALKDSSADVRIAAGFSLTLMGRGEIAIPVMTAAVREGRDRLDTPLYRWDSVVHVTMRRLKLSGWPSAKATPGSGRCRPIPWSG